jgi:hypothetical protein
MWIFSNREAASLIWVIILTCLFLYKNVRQSGILKVIKIALSFSIILFFISYLLYLSLITLTFYYLDLWTLNSLKDSIIWFLFAGLPIGPIVALEKKIGKEFWKNIILNNLKFIVIVEFIINTSNFSLILELLIFPVIMLIVIFGVFSETKEEYSILKKPSIVLQTLFGLFILSYSIYKSIVDFQIIGNIDTLKSFLLPVFYSAISLPYMFVFKIIVLYEDIFNRLKLGAKRSFKLNLLIKLNLLLFCNIRIKRLEIALNMGNYNIMSISSIDEISVMISCYKKALKQIKQDDD